MKIRRILTGQNYGVYLNMHKETKKYSMKFNERFTKKSQSSLVDFLIQDGRFNINGMNVISIHSKQAKNLYYIFTSAVKENDNIKMAMPVNMLTTDFVDLQVAGLVSGNPENVLITKNGKKVLEKMILSDDDCTFALKMSVSDYSVNKKNSNQDIDNTVNRSPSIFRI